MTKQDLMLIRHTQIITDPFPEQSEYNWKRDSQSLIDRFFGIKPKLAVARTIPSPRLRKPPEISIWTAYRMGYDKAYEEIAARLPEDPK